MPQAGDEQLGEMHMPSPWAGAVAVLAMLGFGVLVGSAVSPAQGGGASAPLIAVSPSAKTARASAIAASQPPPLRAEPAATPTASTTSESGGETEVKTEAKEGAKAEAKTGAKGKANGSQPPGAAGKQNTESGGGSTPPTTGLPPIKHVFLIVLSDEGFKATFGPGSPATYLSKTLPKEGELVDDYYAIGGGGLANGIALISGQGPTAQTAADCPLYADITPGTIGAEGQALGSGCVYPRETLTLADQLTSAGKTWKAYVEGIDAGSQSQATSCRHPTLGAADANHAPSGAGGYVTWRNPFVYFHSLTDGTACAQDDVGLGQLAADLVSSSKTPSLAYIAPDRCDDGSEAPCAPGQPAGLAPAEAFLRKVVPEIEKSPAYMEGGLIAITFDQAPQSGPNADSSGCCVTTAYPNMTSATSPANTTSSASTTSSANTTSSASTTTTGTTSATPPGGGKVGLLLISGYVKPGSLNVTGEYNHFALLRSIEDLFGCKPLGYAGAQGLLAFDSSVFNAYR